MHHRDWLQVQRGVSAGADAVVGETNRGCYVRRIVPRKVASK